MVSLLDIAPPEVTREEIDIRGTKLALRGITNLEQAKLFKRFPLFAKRVASDARRRELLAVPQLTATQAAELARLTIEPEEELLLGIEIAPALIAAGLGQIGDKATEDLVDERLTQQEQLACLDIVMRLTAPGKEETGPLVPGGAPDDGGTTTPPP